MVLTSRSFLQIYQRHHFLSWIPQVLYFYHQSLFDRLNVVINGVSIIPLYFITLEDLYRTISVMYISCGDSQEPILHAVYYFNHMSTLNNKTELRWINISTLIKI